MKYRFRPSGSAKPSHLKKNLRLRLMGRNTLQKLKPLPVPVEQVRIDGDFDKPKRKRTDLAPTFERLRVKFALLRAYILVLFKRVSAVIKKALSGIKQVSSRALSFLLQRISKKRSFASLPTLAGAATAAFLVCCISAAYVLFGLFAFYARSYETVTVPSFSGETVEAAYAKDGRFNLIIQYENNPEITDGTVISQTPRAGVTRRIYEKDGYCNIHLTVSRHQSLYVPDGLVGSSLRNASLSLLNSDLSVSVKEEYSSSVPSGEVISVYPKSGARVSSGDKVTLTVSLGEEQKNVFVPDLLGLSETEAVSRLKAFGLSMGQITYQSSSKALGTVINQSISGGISLPQGSSVNLTVSAGEGFSTDTVPELYGLSVEEAEAALRRVGLSVGGVYTVSTSAGKGSVISQSPAAGTPITSAITSVDLGICS